MGKRNDRIRAEHEQQMRAMADFYRLRSGEPVEPARRRSLAAMMAAA